MFTPTNRIACLAGLLALTGSAVFAQSNMKVDVPFTFHTPTATLEAGQYNIDHVAYGGNAAIYKIRNTETGKAVLVTAATPAARKPGDNQFGAKVEFRCAGSYCALATIYRLAAASGDSLSVNLKKAPVGEKVASIVIPARL